MNLTVERKNGTVVLRPEEQRLDSLVAQDFKEKLWQLIENGDRDILIDLEVVEFVDSSGLGAIVSGLKTLGKDGSLSICSVQPSVRSMLELTRLHKVFKIHDTRTQAFQEGSPVGLTNLNGEH